MAKGKSHYVAKTGIHECLPGFVAWAYKEKPLLELVADLHGMTSDQRRTMGERWRVDLRMDLNGVEYAEIDQCWCTIPYTHSE